VPLRVPLLRAGHALQLLQGSQQFFSALVRDIDVAQRGVRLETYIFDFTGSSQVVAYALERAARRGVRVHVVVDGFGSDPLPAIWNERFLDAGVQWRVYSPLGRFGVLWPGSWRRLHRKLCVIDGTVGFCGGINILDDLHDPNHGALAAPRFDFAVRLTGPLVVEMHDAMLLLWRHMHLLQASKPASLSGPLVSARGVPPVGPAKAVPAAVTKPRSRAALVLRDNLRHRTRIERAYRRAIGRARHEIIIANGYFVPGRKMRQALIRAAQRGVNVQLLLQGRYEYFMQYYAARPVYGALLEAGVAINEYSPSFLHAKVAVIDGRWATVGSSNLDPLSLLLAREANVMTDDIGFAQELRRRLLEAIAREGQAMAAQGYAHRPWSQRVMERLALFVMRLALAVQGKKYL
jgi:cardiolipin synthase